ncbi:multicilin [Dunckerocampus dactyliophorus]|uniref:multicilin n=1 Tax=Dunckerocampus dactyliophorus TaxID=161453 RepID=UPI002406A51B|nr:multicilin [Dunckerocampus dactyliophorus]
MSPYMNPNSEVVRTRGEVMKMHGETSAFGVLGRRPPAANKAKVPRSSSPVTVYVELPCNIEQAFPTIAWDDLEDCTSVTRREGDSLGSQVNESDGDEQDFGDFALDFMADSPAILESSLCPAELIPFQGCVIPPLTPQPVFSPAEDNLRPNFSTEINNQNGALWKGITSYQGRMGCSVEVNNKVHETLQRRQEESEEKNLHLRQLACRAKLLASVLEKRITVRETAMPSSGKAISPCKRQRLDQGCETSDSVEEMLRDVSTRCNAVLHASAGMNNPQQDSNTIPMYGSFSGLQTSICKESSATTDESEESVSSFRTSVREHSTIRTQVFPHGRAFTSSTQRGGYRFRWVPNHS